MRLLLLLLFAFPLSAQHTAFELTNDGFVRGEVLERYADGSVRLQTEDNNEITIPAASIVRERRRRGKLRPLLDNRQTRAHGIYATFEPGFNSRYAYFSPVERTRRELYQFRPQLTFSLGKQLGTEWGVGLGSGMFLPDRAFYPIFAETYYVPGQKATAPMFYAAAGWNVVTVNERPGPIITIFDVPSPGEITSVDSRNRSGIFLRSKIGVRVATTGGVDLLPSLGLTYAQQPVTYSLPGVSGTNKVNRNDLFFSFCFAVKW